MWFSAQSHTTLAAELYLAVHRTDTQGVRKEDRPILRVISGSDPLSGIASRQDQLWFELPHASQDRNLKRQSVGNEAVDNRKKKMKMRSQAQRPLDGIFDELQATMKH